MERPVLRNANMGFKGKTFWNYFVESKYIVFAVILFGVSSNGLFETVLILLVLITLVYVSAELH